MWHRWLERLDEAASGLVPLLYLGGLALGTVAYFSGVRLALDGVLVGSALALAAEVHSYLEQRRVRAVWAQLVRLPAADEHRDALTTQLRAHAAILAFLVLFSSFNSVAFVAATWTPTPGFLPDWLQIGLRGAIVPVFFLLTGALSPLSTDAGAVLQAASRDMLHRAIRATTKQWRTRLRAASARKLDLAPVAIALMEDAGDADGARRIRLIAAGLAASEGHHQIEASQQPHTAPPESILAASQTTPDASDRPDTPPDGPGSGLSASKPASRKPSSATSANVTPLRRARPDRRTAARANARSGKRGRAEQKIRAVLAQEPDITPEALAIRAGVSSSSVSKWLAVIEAQRTATQQIAR